MIRASAFNTGAEPAKARAWSSRVWLTLDFPKSIGSQKFTVELVPRPATDIRSAMGQRIGPHMLFIVFAGIQQGPCLEHDNIQTALGQNLGRSTAARAGADDADVVNLG